jgi:hypothetical protein
MLAFNSAALLRSCTAVMLLLVASCYRAAAPQRLPRRMFTGCMSTDFVHLGFGGALVWLQAAVAVG